MRCLVLEDDASCVRLVREALQPICDELLTTGYLKEAIKLAHSELDAVWLDLFVLDARAGEVIGSIPQFRAQCPKATLIVVTGIDNSYKEQAMEAGADAFACKRDLKGFNPQAVAALISEAAVHAMQRGVPSGRILERVTAFFSSLANRVL